MNGIENGRVVTIEHDSREKGLSLRDVEPMALVFKEGRRHLVAWCRLRGEYRSFRLERINAIKLTQEEFSKREDFRVEDYQDGAPAEYHEDLEEVS